MRSTSNNFQDFYHIQGLFCMHEEMFSMLYRCCKFCVMWFWCMDVAVPDTEEENTEPLQSPQLGQAHQG